VRRLIWNIITQERTGRTIILTTHSMEEAEVLCQRIGIMAKGNLRCLGVRWPKRGVGRVGPPSVQSADAPSFWGRGEGRAGAAHRSRKSG